MIYQKKKIDGAMQNTDITTQQVDTDSSVKEAKRSLLTDVLTPHLT